MVVCRATGYVIAVPTTVQGLTKEKLAELFLDKCVFFSGLPSEILTDNAKYFNNKFVHTLCRLAGVDKHECLVYSHKTNGRAERVVKIVVEPLRLFLSNTSAPTDQW